MLILGSGSLWFPQHFVAEQPVVSLPVLSLAFNIAAVLYHRWPEVEPAEADGEPIIVPLPMTAVLTDQLLFISVPPFTVQLWQYSEDHGSVIHSTQEAECVSSKGAWKVINYIPLCSSSSRPLPRLSQVAIKNNIDIFYFSCQYPISLLFVEDGKMGECLASLNHFTKKPLKSLADVSRFCRLDKDSLRASGKFQSRRAHEWPSALPSLFIWFGHTIACT